MKDEESNDDDQPDYCKPLLSDTKMLLTIAMCKVYGEDRQIDRDVAETWTDCGQSCCQIALFS